MIDKKIKTNIFISSILLFGVGFLLHFAYETLDNNFLVGLITPVNESVFEHLKLAVFPIISWWIVIYLLKKEKYSLDKNKWFWSSFISLITSVITILTIYYSSKYIIGKDLAVVNIVSLYIAILLALIIGYYVYKHFSSPSFLISVTAISILIISIFYLTFYPPKIPLFKDNQTNTYGIFLETKK